MNSWIYFSLFSSSFLSATILPVASEFGLALVISQGYNPIFSIIIATFGNSLGGATNLLLGRIGNPNWLKRFKITDDKLKKYSALIQKYGGPIALLSWVPIVGDPLLVILGFLRVPLFSVVLYMIIGKLIRYIIVAFFIQTI